MVNDEAERYVESCQSVQEEGGLQDLLSRLGGLTKPNFMVQLSKGIEIVKPSFPDAMDDGYSIAIRAATRQDVPKHPRHENSIGVHFSEWVGTARPFAMCANFW